MKFIAAQHIHLSDHWSAFTSIVCFCECFIQVVSYCARAWC